MNGADTLAALADIELPAPPDWRPLIALGAILLLCAAGALTLYIRQRGRDRSPSRAAPAPGRAETAAREARTRLDRLHGEWAAGAVDARAAAYRLGTLLRLGLGLPQLRAAAAPAGVDGGEWRETLRLLENLRYAPVPAQALTPEVFARARRWLDGARDGEESHGV